MNGVTDNYLDYEIERWQGPDDDDGPEQTDIECPFCGHYIEWQSPALYCDNCEVLWTDTAQVERDRRDLASYDDHDEPSDEFMFDRAMSIGRRLF